MPTVSIIIATFNAEKTLKIALNSVLNQTFQDWECVIIDGMSKDGTMRIVKEYASKDARFRYISEADKGIFDAFNKGWKIAQGKWIYYLGADDTLDKFAFEKIHIDKIVDSDVIYGNILITFSNNQKAIRKSQSPSTLRYKMFACHQSILVKRSMIEKVNGFNIAYNTCADFDMMQRIFLLKAKFKYVNVCIANFSYTGISSKYSFKAHHDHYIICKSNKSNYCPLLFHLVHEARLYLGYLHKRILKRI
ncbi:glycosyltransferase family 2 protein [uncultured Bacteroides sp.]|uniref:glycosyltransferase family 2 protein n=1 Tax=uncultured Bacteroides sp. TaxID=162156 RepID=UPI002588C663|nr:glycosyltransferase family 2 protein [uncultured Bacteroides sp.]